MQRKTFTNNMAWLFVDKELILLSLNSTKWPEKLKPSQKLSMIEGQSYDLRRKEEIYSCRLLTKGNFKYVERAMLSYQAGMDSGKRPSDLKTTILTASKAPLVEEVDFLSSSRAPNLTSTAITLGKESGKAMKSKASSSQRPVVNQSRIREQVFFNHYKLKRFQATKNVNFAKFTSWFILF